MPRGKKDGIISQSQPATAPSSASIDSEDDLPQQKHISLSPDMQAFLACITASFTSSFNTCVDKIIDALDKKLNQRIDSQASEIFDLNKKCERLEKANRDLITENADLRGSVKSLSNKIDFLAQSIDDLEQYSKGSNLLLHGIPVMADMGSDESNLNSRVVDYINDNLAITISENDISALHRLTRSAQNTQANASPSSIKTPPILIQFANRKTRNLVLSKRKLLKGKKVLLTEHLTTKKTQMLKKVNELVTAKKLLSSWTHDGRILAKNLNNETIVMTNTNINQF